MAIQGCRPRWKPNGAGRIFERDEDFFAPGNFVNGADEGKSVAQMH